VLTLALAVSALAAPMAQAKLSPAGKYGPLDPWAYKLIHQNPRSVPLITEHSAGQNSAARPTRQSVPLITEHSAGQNNAARPTRRSVPLITEHSAGQNSSSQTSAAAKYGPLDPAIAAAIRKHSLGQNGVSRTAAASLPADTPNGFDWGAAEIGATVAFAAMLLALGVATLIWRRSRARLAVL